MTQPQTRTPPLMFYRAMRLAGMAPRDAWRLRSTVMRVMGNDKVCIEGVTLTSPRHLEVPLEIRTDATDEHGRYFDAYVEHVVTVTPPRGVGARYILPCGWAERTL